MPWDFAFLLLVLTVIVPWRGTVQIRRLIRRPTVSAGERLSIYASTIAFQWLLTGVAFWRCRARGLSLASLALTLPRLALTSYVALALALLVTTNQLVTLRHLARVPVERHGLFRELAARLLPQDRLESFAFLALAGTAAVCEEFLYRGFVFAVLLKLPPRSLAVAIIGSSLLFSLAHLYQGRLGLLATFTVALVFAGARIWTASLIPSVIAHFVGDAVAGLAAPRFLTLRHLGPSPPTLGHPNAPRRNPKQP